MNVGRVSCLLGIGALVPESTCSTPAPSTLAVVAPPVGRPHGLSGAVETGIQSAHNGQDLVVTVVRGSDETALELDARSLGDPYLLAQIMRQQLALRIFLS